MSASMSEKRRSLTANEVRAAEIIKDSFELRKERGEIVSQDDLANRMGFNTQGAVSHYLNKRRPISFEVGLKFCAVLGLDPAKVNPEWRHVYNLSSHGSVGESVLKDGGAEYYSVPSSYQSEYLYLSYVSHQDNDHSHSDPGEDMDDEQPPIVTSFSKTWIKRKNFNKNNLKIIQCKGDSMSPTLNDGDLVLINSSDKTIVDGKLYGVDYGGEVKVKRLFKNYDGSISIRSDNPIFKDETVKKGEIEQFELMGRAVWHGGEL